MRVTTNRVPRLIIDDYQLTPDERKDFDYLNWDSIDAGNDSATFVRYQGRLYDIGEFTNAGDSELNDWDGYAPDSFFSGVVIRYVDSDHVVMGTYYAE